MESLKKLYFQTNSILIYRSDYTVASKWYSSNSITRIKKQRTKHTDFYFHFQSAKCVWYFIFFEKKSEISLAFIHPDFYSIIFPQIKFIIFTINVPNPIYNPQVPENRHFVILYRKCKIFKKSKPLI